MSSLPETVAASLPVPGDVLAGKYRVEAELGRGGMGVVYRATHLLTRRAVALKWLLPDVQALATARQRLIREAHTAATISDPSIVDVFDIVDDGRGAFLVMELLDGESLSDKLARERLPVAVILQLFLPVMRAVARAHESGIIHRDLKPDNLFVCRRADGEESLKVLDFGISKLIAPGEGEVSITRSGVTVGSPHYMSLEQLQGLKDLDGRVDVYAFGVILYEALTGQKPFRGTSYGEIAARIATQSPELPRALRPNIPPMLERAVLGALARDRQARYPDMRSLIHALEVALHPELDVLGVTAPMGVPGLAPRALTPADDVAPSAVVAQIAPPRVTTPARARSTRGVLAFAVMAAIIVLAFAGWWSKSVTERQHSKLPPPAADSKVHKSEESKVPKAPGTTPTTPGTTPTTSGTRPGLAGDTASPPEETSADSEALPTDPVRVSTPKPTRPRPATEARTTPRADEGATITTPAVEVPALEDHRGTKPVSSHRAGAISPSDF